MSDVTYPLFPILAFLGFILPLIPLRWHLQALNSGTCYFIFWSSLACFNQFINSVLWADNAINLAPAWCEISIRIMMAASVGIPASSLCINRRLYIISNVRTASISFSEKRRAIYVDSLICLLFPMLFVALQYVVQGHRFNIYEQIGCYPALYNTLPTFFLSTIWPLVLGLISMVYCCLSLRAFARRRVEFSLLVSQNSTFTLSRYFRLMGLAMVEICATTPLSIFIIWLNASAAPVGPWISWADTHYNYSRIEQIPAVLWQQNHLTVVSLELSRWLNPLCSFVFFAFFGFANESLKNYRLAWSGVTRWFGIGYSTLASAKSSKQSTHSKQNGLVTPDLPIFSLPLHALDRKDTIDSISTRVSINKKGVFDSQPSTPSSPGTCNGLPAYEPSTESPVSPPVKNNVSLTRSRTL